MTKERTLTEKEERFCLSFAKTANATAAAIEAGYSKNSAGVTASRKLRKANIKARLKELAERKDKNNIMDINQRQELLTKIATEEPDPNARIRAIDTLNKMDGLYIQKHEVEIKKSLAAIIEEIDDA